MRTKAQRQGLVWGGLLVLFGIVMLVETFADLNEWIWVAILTVAGLGAFAVFLTDRSDWGLLIPAYVLWAIAGMLILITLDILQDETIATFVLSAIALPFLVGFLRNRERWGLLIPAYILFAVGIMVGLIGIGLLNDLLIPAYVLFAVSIPFFVAYPNLYLVSDSMSILITHGHYLEAYWSLLSEITPKILEGDLDIGQFLDLTELVAVNFPLNQMASSGVGQAGPLTKSIRLIQRKVKDGDLDAIKKYLNNLDENILDPHFDYRRFDPREWISDKVIDIVKKNNFLIIVITS